MPWPKPEDAMSCASCSFWVAPSTVAPKLSDTPSAPAAAFFETVSVSL